jgi:thiamine kinase-like enzyme
MTHSLTTADVATHESHVVSEALEDLGRSRFATTREKELIRSIGMAVDADRESFVNNLMEKGFTSDLNWIRVRRKLVLVTWILCGTTRGAWEGWDAKKMWEECKKRMRHHKSGK